MLGSKRFAALVLLLLISAFAVGCSGGDAESSGGDAGAGGGVTQEELDAPEAFREGADEGVAYDSVGTNDAEQRSASEIPNVGPSVIKTATLRLEVKRGGFRGSVQEAIDAVERHGGFVLSTEIGGGDATRGSLVLRVPAEQFESTLGELKGMAEEVLSESVAGQDVSQEFVDLQARLRNYEAQESVLLGLMDKATTVSASIRVQRELQNVQMEIERLRGRINFLQDQTAYSTISLDLSEAPKGAPAPKGAFGKAWAQAKETFVSVVSAVIVGSGFVLPVAILAAIAALIIRLLRPRIPGPKQA